MRSIALNPLKRERTKLYINSHHVSDTIYKHYFLVGYLGRHHETNNCLYEMSHFITLNDKIKRNYNYKIKAT